ncbi:MAG: quinoprotein dehydrogenase-associated SoxYZ-like carrier, partial [Burkholderiales bacterium]
MQLRYVLLCMLSVFATLAAAANPNPEPDESKIPEWQVIRSLLFGDREINPDDKQVVRVYLNTRADDASTVPVMINGLIDQSQTEYIKTLYLIVDRNPMPTAGVFRFTPESGRVKLETRLRFEQYSFVRAVAELNDGRLYMSQRWVKAAGGCSAPMGKNGIPAALLGKMRFRMDDAVEYDKPALVQVQVRHPNESALASDLDPDHVPQFIRSVQVDYNDKPVMTGEVNFS